MHDKEVILETPTEHLSFSAKVHEEFTLLSTYVNKNYQMILFIID